MADTGITPQQAYTATTTAAAYQQQQKAQGPVPSVGFNRAYFRTIPGILKIVELVAGFLTIIFCSIKDWVGIGGGWVNFVAVLSIIITAILFFLYFMNLIFKLPGPMPFVLFIYYAGTTACYAIASIVAFARAWYGATIIITGITGIIATGAYAFDLFHYYNAWRGENTLFLKGMERPAQEGPQNFSDPNQQYGAQPGGGDFAQGQYAGPPPQY